MFRVGRVKRQASLIVASSSRIPQGNLRRFVTVGLKLSSPSTHFRCRPCTGIQRTMSLSSAQTKPSVSDLRKHLISELKSAMKAKDTFKSTVLRSVLAEVYVADKTPSGPIPNSNIVSILKKSIDRRKNSASEFAEAKRADLADNETREVELLSQYLPPSMSETDIDSLLQKLIDESRASAASLADTKKASGMILKSFFSQVDKSLVDGQLVKKRLEALLAK